MKEIFFGTANRHKLEEIREILAGRFLIKSFLDLEEIPEVEETEPDIEGNAQLKARAYHRITGLPCFADDTGLEVIALGGAPGVNSARYAGPEQNAQRNIQKLLKAMEGTADRRAVFRTVIAWCDGKQERFFEGRLSGSIIVSPRGSGGFGYDPVFVPEGYSNTLAEMSPGEKNAISHRRNALEKFIYFLDRNGSAS